MLHHQASEKGVVTQLLKDGRTGCLAYIIKGGLAFQLEFLNRGRISENFTKQKYFTLFWEGFVLGFQFKFSFDLTERLIVPQSK